MEDVESGTVRVDEFLKILAVESVVGLARKHCNYDLLFEQRVICQLVETNLELFEQAYAMETVLSQLPSIAPEVRVNICEDTGSRIRVAVWVDDQGQGVAHLQGDFQEGGFKEELGLIGLFVQHVLHVPLFSGLC